MICASLILASLVLTACGTDIGDPIDDPTPPDPPAVDLYRDNCSRCHGSSGDGTNLAPQILSPVRAYATFVIRNGRGREMGFADEMPAFTADQLPDLEPIFAWLERPPHPTGGQALYVRYCANCHGANAQGGRVEQDVTRETDELTEKVREGHGGTSYGNRTKYMPAWSTSQLSSADVAAIAAYLATLPPGPGDDDDDDDDDDERPHHVADAT